jgi:hypothetical protein
MTTFPTPGAQFRARVSTYGSGTVSASAVGKALPSQAPMVNAFATLSSSSAAVGLVGINYAASTAGASTAGSVLSLGTTAATSLKAAAGRVVGVMLQNSAATLRSVKMFNVLVGSITMGTTAAAYEIDIPAGGQVSFSLEGGIAHSTAIVYAVTAAKGLTDNTSATLAANDVSGVILYA